MKAETIAVKLMKIASTTHDSVLQTIKILELVKQTEVPCDQITDIYSKIHAGDIDIAFVKSRIRIDEGSRKELEKKVQKRFEGKKIIFDYEVDKSFVKSIEIRIKDDILSI